MYKSRFRLRFIASFKCTTMSSTKAFFCDLCIILVAGVVLVLADEKPNSVTPDGVPRGNCTCGGFPATVVEGDSAPLISQSPGLVVNCDDEGDTTCKNLCVALATAAKAKGPDVLCNILKTVNELKLSAFYKICDKPWTYADMSAELPLCCEDSKAKVCPSVEAANNTDIDAKTVM